MEQLFVYLLANFCCFFWLNFEFISLTLFSKKTLLQSPNNGPFVLAATIGFSCLGIVDFFMWRKVVFKDSRSCSTLDMCSTFRFMFPTLATPELQGMTGEGTYVPLSLHLKTPSMF
jgi:hypothetical protein